MAGCANETLYEAGETICLYVPEPVAPDSTYLWTHDGAALDTEPRAEGANSRVLRIYGAQPADSGFYACAYDDGQKAPQTFGIHVVVGVSLPLGGIALGAALCSVGLCAAFAARKRKD